MKAPARLSSLPQEQLHNILSHVPPEDLLGAAIALAPLLRDGLAGVSAAVVVAVAMQVPDRLVVSPPKPKPQTLLAAARLIGTARLCWECRVDPKLAESLPETPEEAARACLAWAIELRRGGPKQVSILDAFFPEWSLQTASGMAVATFAAAAALGNVATVRDLLGTRILKQNGGQDLDFEVGNRSALTWACRNGHLPVVELLVSHGASLSLANYCDSTYCDSGAAITDDTTQDDSVLVEACQGGHADVVRFLVDCGRITTAQMGFALNHSSDHPEVIRILLEKGASPYHLVDFESLSAFQNACCNASISVETLRLFLDFGADPNSRVYGCKSTALHLACQRGYHGQPDVLELLINRGANVEARGFLGETPFLSACRSGSSIACLQLLLERGADLSACNEKQQSALHLACASDHSVELAAFLLLQSGIRNARQGRIRNTRKGGIQGSRKTRLDVNAVDAIGATPLHVAAAAGNVELVQMLLAAGARFTPAGPDLDSPLHSACLSGSLAVVSLLIDSGADPNVGAQQNPRGTPLHYAAALQRDAALVRFLLSHGASTKAASAHGWTALDFFLGLGVEHLVNFDIDASVHHNYFFESKEARPSSSTVETTGTIASIFLNELGMPVPRKKSYGNNALHIACYKADVATVKLLLNFGMDPMAPNSWGETALICTMDIPRAVDLNADLNLEARGEIALLLLARCTQSADLMRGRDGQTLFHLACGLGNVSVFREILKRHPWDLYFGDHLGRTAFHYAFFGLSVNDDAKDNNKAEVVRTLLEMGADPNMRLDPSKTITALFYCILVRNFEVMRLLLSHGADPNLQSSAGMWRQAPLTYLCHFPCSDIESGVRLLLDYGADVNGGNPDGVTPLELVLKWDEYQVPWKTELIMDRGAVARLLVEKGAVATEWPGFPSPELLEVDPDLVNLVRPKLKPLLEGVKDGAVQDLRCDPE